MDRFCEDLLLLAIHAGRGSLGRVPTVSYGLMGAELVQLAAGGRVEIVDAQIVVTSREPTEDENLNLALAALGESASPVRPDDWVRRPRPRITGSYLERLAAAGVIQPETRLRWFTRWQITDPARLADARQRLDLIVRSAGEVDLSQAAYAGLACAIGLDRLLYPGRAKRAERGRLREVAAGRWTVSPAGAGGPADIVTAAEQATAAVYAATHAAVHATSHAAITAAHGAGGHAGGGHGGH